MNIFVNKKRTCFFLKIIPTTFYEYLLSMLRATLLGMLRATLTIVAFLNGGFPDI